VIRPSRLETLTIPEGAENGADLLYCPYCDWQADAVHIGMNPKCPECGYNLHYICISDELREILSLKPNKFEGKTAFGLG